jgi:hypothetical protein
MDVAETLGGMQEPLFSRQVQSLVYAKGGRALVACMDHTLKSLRKCMGWRCLAGRIRWSMVCTHAAPSYFLSSSIDS